MRVLALFLLLLVWMAGSAVRAETPDDFLCRNAPVGMAAPVPAPFDEWLVLVCPSDGQALVPVEGSTWLAHGSADRVSILALPPGVTAMPKNGDFDPRYGVRFKELLAAEAKGAKRERALRFLAAALGKEPMPRIGRVLQLDAVSVIYETRYNIFFFLPDGGRPRHALACIDQCRQALLIDILTAAEARARIAGLR